MTEVDQDPTGAIGAVPVCAKCGSKDIVRDAWAEWDPDTGLWGLKTVFDEVVCETCGGSTEAIWKWLADYQTRRIRHLNDATRTAPSADGVVVFTAGVQERGAVFLEYALHLVAIYNRFDKDNDPHGEHDFGALKIAGDRIFWKIDYYNTAMTMHSPDAGDPLVTRRVLTIMLADEY